MDRRLCSCQVADWYALRVALGLTQPRMAALLCVSERQIRRLEAAGQHTCPPEASVKWFRLKLLLYDEYRDRLSEAGYPYPFPADLRTRRTPQLVR